WCEALLPPQRGAAKDYRKACRFNSTVSVSRRMAAMWQSMALGFLAGVFFGNGIPHFVKGITKERYPCVFGGGPMPNLLAGWLSLGIAGLLTHWIDLQDRGLGASISARTGPAGDWLISCRTRCIWTKVNQVRPLAHRPSAIQSQAPIRQQS